MGVRRKRSKTQHWRRDTAVSMEGFMRLTPHTPKNDTAWGRAEFLGNCLPFGDALSLADPLAEWSRVFAWHRYFRSLPRRTRRALQRTCKQSLAGVALLFALGHAPAEAATITVNASCRLVNAIRAANTDTATGGCPARQWSGHISLPTKSTQTLTTVNNSTFGPTGLPVISSQITIEGRNSTIRRGSSAPDFRIFAVAARGSYAEGDDGKWGEVDGGGRRGYSERGYAG